MTRADRAVLITMALGWLLFAAYYLAGGGAGTAWFRVFGLVYVWIPGLVALALARREGLRLRVWTRPNRWWLAAWLLPPLLAAASVLAGLPLGRYVGLQGALELAAGRGVTPWAAVLLQVFLGGASAGAFAALGEELMWRGYLWEHTRELGFWPASLYTGAVWGFWYAPLIYFFGWTYPDHRFLGVFFMVIFTVLLTPWLLYLRERSGGLAAPAIFHGMIYTVSPLSAMVFARGGDLYLGLTGLAGFVVLALANFYLRRLAPPV